MRGITPMLGWHRPAPNEGRALNHHRRGEPFATATVLSLAALYISDLASMSFDPDGLVYGNMAAMLAQGHGSFWKLPFFDANVDAFYDHPPLGIYLQSLLLGMIDHQHTAIRLYMIVIMVAFVCAFRLLCRTRLLEETQERCNWWPVLVLAVMPITLRVLTGNPLEALLATTSMIAIGLGLRAMHAAVAGPAIGTALLVYAGLLVKGPVALFPLIALPCALLVGRRSIPAALAFATIALGTVAALCIMTWLWDEDARTWLEQYWMHQLRASILGERLIQHGRGHALARLAMNVGIGTAVAFALAFATGQYITGQGRIRWRPDATLWMIIGLSASLPVLLSARQYEHYLMSSLPYFALAIAGTIPPMRLPSRRVLLISSISCWTLVLATFTVRWNSPGDDEGYMTTARGMAELTAPEDIIVYCPNRLASSHRETSYLYRNHARRHRSGFDQVSPGTKFWLACDHVPEGLSDRTAELDLTIPVQLRGIFRYVERL